MIFIFSAAERLTKRPPRQDRQTFFEHAALQRDRGDAFSPAEIRDALLASEPFEHDPDLLFRGELPADSPSDLTYCGLAGLLLLRHAETLLGALDPMKCLLAQVTNLSECC